MNTTTLAFALCGWLALALPARATSYIVRTTDDDGAGSLREALDDADDGDTILFASDVRGEIRLGEPLEVDDDVTVKGPGADVVSVRAGADGPAIDVSADATITGLTIVGGTRGIDLARGKLTLIECAIRDAGGPGVKVGGRGTLTLVRTLVADSRGPGIAAGDGAVICANSTLYGNEIGLHVDDGRASLANCTIANNRRAGIENTDGDVQVQNSLFAGNVPACAGAIGSQGHNLADDASCRFAAAGDQNGVDPMLGVLFNNGGRTATAAPGGASPAVDAGDPAGCTDANGALLTIDQRGVRRPSGGRCDIGAVEAQALSASRGTVVNRILALVDGDPITLYELRTFAASDVRLREAPGVDEAALLDLLVTKRVIEKEVEAQGIAVPEPEIDRYIASIRERNGLSEQQLDQALAQQGLTRAQYRQQVKEELQRAQLINREIRGKVSVSPEEIERYHAEHEGEAAADEKVVISHIVLQLPPDANPAQVAAVEARAAQLHAQLEDGADFAELARQESEDGSAAAGGKLGAFRRGEMRDELEAAVDDLDPGEFSPPVRSSSAIHIVRLDERMSAGDAATIPDAKRDEIKERLYAEALEERYNRWLKEDLRRRHHVEIRP